MYGKQKNRIGAGESPDTLCTAEPCFVLMELDRDNNSSKTDLDMLSLDDGF